jgi:hypothetical protein
MTRTCFLMTLFSALVVCPLLGQGKPPLQNGQIVEMVKAGFDQETIVSVIDTSPTNFDTSVQGLVMLKNSGVNGKVIRAMILKSSSGNTPSSAPQQSSGSNPSHLSLEIGVYSRREGTLVEVPPEVATWKTGGFMKSVATMGLTKGHVNGVVTDPHSRTRLSLPIEFVIVTVEGTSVVEYQLLKLKRKKNRREFRAMTGGIIHASGGAQKNVVRFDYEKTAPRTYKVKLPSLEIGEYGFLAPGAAMSASAASIGKIYTFGLE